MRNSSNWNKFLNKDKGLSYYLVLTDSAFHKDFYILDSSSSATFIMYYSHSNILGGRFYLENFAWDMCTAICGSPGHMMFLLYYQFYLLKM